MSSVKLKPVTLKRVLQITGEEWSSLTGTNLYATMFRNRVCIVRPGPKSYGILSQWCKDNCSDIFYIPDLKITPSGIYPIYFASEADATLFYMAWQGVSPSPKETTT